MSTRKQISGNNSQGNKHAHISFSIDDKMRIVLEGMKGDISINDLCSRENINPNLLSTWTKLYLEGARKGLGGLSESDIVSKEIEIIKCENQNLKQLVAELTLEVRMLKK